MFDIFDNTTLNKLKTRNIIFDFGGVLYKIDPRLTLISLAELSGNDSLGRSDPFASFDKEVIHNFERGKKGAPEFRDFLRHALEFEADDETIDRAWNETLLGVRPEAEEIVGRLSRNYNVFLLSNTNEIHYSRFAPECENLFDKFQKLYFSFLIGRRKPDVETYEYIIEELGINPGETLFIDDTKENIDSAAKAGLGTIYFNKNKELSDLLHIV